MEAFTEGTRSAYDQACDWGKISKKRRITNQQVSGAPKVHQGAGKLGGNKGFYVPLPVPILMFRVESTSA